MPQLDFTTYIGQVFWFFVCFGILYLFTNYIILPRITAILKERKGVIDNDLSAASKLDNEAYDIQIKTENLKREAAKNYQTKIEEAAKDASRQRDRMIDEMKEKIDLVTQNSYQDLQNFITKSQAESELLVKSLAQKIKEKLIQQTPNSKSF